MTIRQEREKAYNREYEKKLFNKGDKQICTYCGFPANSVDHTLSLHARDHGKTGDKYLVPCCMKCNLKASRKHFSTLYEKVQFIYKSYLKELEKYPYWSPEEIEELGDTMKIYIIDAQNYREQLQDRIAWGWDIIQKVEK